jgi:hypothetical protein
MLRQLLQTSRILRSRPPILRFARTQPFSTSFRRYVEQSTAEPIPDPRDQQIAEMKVCSSSKTSANDTGEICKVFIRL